MIDAAWLLRMGENARQAATMSSAINGMSQRSVRLNIGLPSFFLQRGRPHRVLTSTTVGVRGRRKRPHHPSSSTPAPTVIASMDGQRWRARRGDYRIAGQMQVCCPVGLRAGMSCPVRCDRWPAPLQVGFPFIVVRERCIDTSRSRKR